MGFLSGLGQFAANTVAPTLNVAAARAQASRQEEDQQRQQLIQAILLQKQLEQAKIDNALKAQQTATDAAHGSLYGAQQKKLENPDEKVERGPGGQGYVVDKNAPNGFRTVGPAPTPASPAPHFEPTSAGVMKWNPATQKLEPTGFQPFSPPPNNTYITGTDPSTGSPTIFAGPTKGTPTLTNLGVGKPQGQGMSGSAQTQQARLLAAVSEARLADERMRTFEDKLLSGSAQISPLKQAVGSLTTNLTDTKSPIGALMQAGSEFGLNKSDSEYSQYLRDASTIGRAEQMMSPRGGNETMVRANALLSRAGSGAMANTINASRMARQALFGQAGGIAQSMTPQQNQKLERGVQQIKGGETKAPSSSGLTPAQQQRAATDPEYAAFLRSQGKMP